MVQPKINCRKGWSARARAAAELPRPAASGGTALGRSPALGQPGPAPPRPAGKAAAALGAASPGPALALWVGAGCPGPGLGPCPLTQERLQKTLPGAAPAFTRAWREPSL